MLADYHVHTAFSDDSEAVMEDVVQEAIYLQIDEICFTDHVDYGVKMDHTLFRCKSAAQQRKFKKRLNTDYPNYFKEAYRLQQKYEGKIRIKIGLEFGIQQHTTDLFQKLFDSYPLDFVILSCHQVEDKEFWTNEFQQGMSAAEYNARYYQEIYECICKYKDYSVLGHLDMIQRYHKTRFPFERSEEIIERILAQVIKDKKGIEVNTSSFRYGLSDLMREQKILRMYRDMGGTIITLGSDCHNKANLAAQIPYVKEKLKGLGFKYFCTFVKMAPVFRKL